MGIIRNAANRKIRGRVGDTTYYVSMDRQIARQALNSSNYGETARRTEAQQTRRVKWSNLVNFYKVSKSWMPKAFESKKKGQTDYNRFMSININASSVALTRDQALQGGCVVESFVITQGSLPSVNVVAGSNIWITDIALGSLVIADSTTIAQFTEAVTLNNPHIKDGMQLSFVSYQQFVSAVGVPQVICTFYEVTLDANSTELLRRYLPSFCSRSVGGFLGTGEDVSIGAFAYVLSDNSNGGIRVSSQTLINNNVDMIMRYSAPDQFVKAIASYGLDTEVVLSPISRVEQNPTAQPVSINSWYWPWASKHFIAGDVVGAASNVIGQAGHALSLSGLESNSVSSVFIMVYDDKVRHYATSDNWTVEGDEITFGPFAWSSASWTSKDIVAIGVELVSGDVVTMPFVANTQDND